MQAMPIVNQPMPSPPKVAGKEFGKESGKEFLPMLDQATAKGRDDADLAGAAMVGDAAVVEPVEQSPLSVDENEMSTPAEVGEEVVFTAGQDGKAVAAIMAGDFAAKPVEVTTVLETQAELQTGNSEQLVADPGQPSLVSGLVDDVVTGPQLPVEAKSANAQVATLAVAARQSQQHAADVANVVAEQVATSQLKNEMIAPSVIRGEVVQAVSDDLQQQVKDPLAVPVTVVEDFEAEVPQADKKITDPRFAGLLNKPDVETALRQRQAPVEAAAVVVAPSGASSGAAATGMVVAEGSEGVANAVAMGEGQGPGTSAEALMNRPAMDVSQASHHAAAAAHNHAAPTSAVNFDEAVVSLRNGVMVPESRIVDQTLEHLSIHARGDSSAVTVKLHPEELGELQLRMVMEGDQLKVHLQAQNQQVQDVLERHFPRLRDALQEQGLTVEDFQVSVDSGNQEQQQSAAEQEGSSWAADQLFASMDEGGVDPIVDIATVTSHGVSGGISVRI